MVDSSFVSVSIRFGVDAVLGVQNELSSYVIQCRVYHDNSTARVRWRVANAAVLTPLAVRRCIYMLSQIYGEPEQLWQSKIGCRRNFYSKVLTAHHSTRVLGSCFTFMIVLTESSDLGWQTIC